MLRAYLFWMDLTLEAQLCLYAGYTGGGQAHGPFWGGLYVQDHMLERLPMHRLQMVMRD